MKKEITYEVGDRVQIIKTNWSGSGSKALNKKGVINRITAGMKKYEVCGKLNKDNTYLGLYNFEELKPLKSPKKVKPKKEKPQKKVNQYSYWTIERVDLGYIVNNSAIKVTFPTKHKMFKWLEEHTK